MKDSAGLSELQAQIRALRQQLATLEQQQELMLYTLSHDLRTPVMTVLGFTDMLLADVKEATTRPSTKQYLEHIRNAARRQITLVEGLLKLSQLRQRELQTALIDLSAAAKTCLQDLLPTSADSRYVMQINATPLVRCDAQLLSLVIGELLSNAIKFTRAIANPTITFGSEQRQKQLVFFVRDNGIGFDAKYSHRLFETFRRLHPQQEYEGAGIGLVTAATIIQRHGGQIWAESQPGLGATFYFTLKAA